MTDGASRADGAASGDAVARLWLETVQGIVARAAHDIKNLMNGVAVNLEVVRSRSRRSGIDAAAVSPFAESAAGQFEQLTAVTEALIAISRQAREPVDIVDSWNTLVTLAAPGDAASAWKAGGEPAEGRESLSAAPGELVRLALASALLATAELGHGVICTIARDGDAEDIRITIACADDGAAAPPLRADVAAAVRPAGIRARYEEDAIILTLPTATPTAAA